MIVDSITIDSEDVRSSLAWGSVGGRVPRDGRGAAASVDRAAGQCCPGGADRGCPDPPPRPGRVPARARPAPRSGLPGRPSPGRRALFKWPWRHPPVPLPRHASAARGAKCRRVCMSPGKARTSGLRSGRGPVFRPARRCRPGCAGGPGGQCRGGPLPARPADRRRRGRPVGPAAAGFPAIVGRRPAGNGLPMAQPLVAARPPTRRGNSRRRPTATAGPDHPAVAVVMLTWPDARGMSFFRSTVARMGRMNSCSRNEPDTALRPCFAVFLEASHCPAGLLRGNRTGCTVKQFRRDTPGDAESTVRSVLAGAAGTQLLSTRIRYSALGGVGDFVTCGYGESIWPSNVCDIGQPKRERWCGMRQGTTYAVGTANSVGAMNGCLTNGVAVR
jgi:hypothetical protein